MILRSTFASTLRTRPVIWLLVFFLFASFSADAFDLANSVKPRKKIARTRRGAGVSSLVNVGGHAFSSYLYPTISYQRALSKKVSLGLLGLYSKSEEGNTQSLLHGGMLTVNLYLGSREFTGVWFQGGCGFWNYDTRVNGDVEKFYRNVYMATVGYRGLWEDVLRVGVGVGVLKTDPIDSKQLNVKFGGTVPLLTVDIGFGF